MYKYYLSILIFTPFLMQAMELNEPKLVCPSAPKKVRQIPALKDLCKRQVKTNARAMPTAQKDETVFNIVTQAPSNITEQLTSQEVDYTDPNRIATSITRLNTVLERKRRLDFGE